jgi:recombinational DNA repair protein (RecF pathway)
MESCDHCGRLTDEKQLRFTCKKFVCLNCVDIVEEEALQNTIDLLMSNDNNGTWDEIETIEELIEA